MLKRTALGLGWTLILFGSALAGYLLYIEWWLHPELTRGQLLWEYPLVSLGPLVLFMIGITLINKLQ